MTPTPAGAAFLHTVGRMYNQLHPDNQSLSPADTPPPEFQRKSDSQNIDQYIELPQHTDEHPRDTNTQITIQERINKLSARLDGVTQYITHLDEKIHHLYSVLYHQTSTAQTQENIIESQQRTMIREDRKIREIRQRLETIEQLYGDLLRSTVYAPEQLARLRKRINVLKRSLRSRQYALDR